MPNHREDKAFQEMIEGEVQVSSLLDSAISWIKNNLNPAEVFEHKELEDWAESNGFVKD